MTAAAGDGFHCGIHVEGAEVGQSHWITDRFVDHVVCGMLAPEWEIPPWMSR